MIEQQQFWDWHWQNWRERKTVNLWKECRHEAILSVLGSLPIDRPRILDLGCGHGWFTAKLARFAETTGIDLSEEGIRQARLRDPHVKFVAGNLYSYPLPIEHSRTEDRAWISSGSGNSLLWTLWGMGLFVDRRVLYEWRERRAERIESDDVGIGAIKVKRLG